MLSRFFCLIRKRKKSLLLLLVVTLMIGLPIGYQQACNFAKNAIIEEVSKFHGGEVQIESARIGLNSITIKEIRLDDGNQQEWCSAPQAVIRLPLLSAIFSGDFQPDAIEIHQPEIQLNLDEQGKLAINFQANESNNDLDLKLEDAKLVIRQPGRKTVTANDLELQITVSNNQREATGSIGDLLGARLEVKLNQQNDSGSLTGIIEGLPLDSSLLAQLPLMPEQIFKTLTTQGSTQGTFRFQLEPSGIEDYQIELQPDLALVRTGEFDSDFTNIDRGKVTITPGQIQLDSLDVDCMGGQNTLSGKMVLQNNRWQGDYRMQAKQVELAELKRALNLGFEMTGPVDFQANFGLMIDSESYEIDGIAKGQATEFTVETLPSKRIRTEVELDKVRIYFKKPKTGPSTTGFVRVRCDNPQQNLHETFVALGKRYKVPVPEVAGNGVVKVNVVVPLDPTDRKESFWADINVASKDMSIADIPFETFQSAMTLFPNRYRIHRAQLVSARGENVDFGGTIHFESDTRVRVALDPSTIHSALLSHYVNAENTKVVGEINLEGEVFADRQNDGSIHTHGVGMATSEFIQVESFLARQLTADLEIDNSNLKFNRVEAQILKGGFNGAATLNLADDTLDISAHVQNVELPAIAPWLSGAAEDLQLEKGIVQLNTRAHLKLGKALAYRFEGAVQSQNIQVNGWSSDSASAQFLIDETQFQIDHIRVAAAQGQLPSHLQSPIAIPDSLSGNIEAAVVGSMLSNRWHASGSVMVHDSEKQLLANPIAAEIDADAEGIQIDTMDPGAAFQLAFKSGWDPSSPASLVGQLKQLDVEPWLALFSNGQSENASESFNLSGNATAKFSFENLYNAEKLTGEFEFSGLDAVANRIEFKKLSGNAKFENAQTQFKFLAQAFDGNVKASGSSKTQSILNAKIEEPIQLELENASLQKLLQTFRLPAKNPQLSGQVSLRSELKLDMENVSNLEVKGQLTVENFRANNADLAKKTTADFDWNSARVKLEKIAIGAGQGTIQGNILWPFDDPQRGDFQLQIARVNLQSLTPFYPEIKEQGIEGIVSGRVKGKIQRSGPNIRMSGSSQLKLQNGRFKDFEWQLANTQLLWNYDPNRNQGKVSTQSASLETLNGKILSNLTLSWGDRLKFDYRGRAKNIDTSLLSKASIAKQVFGQHGKLNGELRLASSHFRSLNDVKGSFQGAMDQSQALQLPVLNSISPYVNRSQFKNRRFEEGRIHLDLRQSRINVRQFSFADSFVQVLVEGSVQLDGRMNLSAIVHVGQNNQDPIRQILTSPLLASSSPPVALIAQFDRLLSDRLLFFKITGNLRRPRVQVETTKILRQETLKFILEKTYNLGGRPNSILNRSTIRLR